MTDATPRASRAAQFEGIDAGAQHGPQRDRDARWCRLGQGHATVAPLQRAVLEERPDRLADEQRVATRPLVDAARPIGIDGGASHERGETRGLGLGQATQLEALDAGRRRPGRQIAGPGTGQDEQRQLAGELDEGLDQPGARRVEPVQVVDDHDPRSGRRQEART